MDDRTITLDQVLALAKRLTPLEKVRLIERVVPDLEASLTGIPLRHSGGTLGDLAASPLCGLWTSRTDIDDSRAYARLLRKNAELRGHG